MCQAITGQHERARLFEQSLRLGLEEEDYLCWSHSPLSQQISVPDTF